MKTAGYSGTPLGKKLGIKNGFKIRIVNEPQDYYKLFSDLPTDLKQITHNSTKKDFIHYFVKSESQLNEDIKHLKREMEQNGILWISWPKKASKVETDLNGNIVREIGLRNGLVDIKVCAVNNIWSGLKFVIPVKDRN
ncbi:DUF3052 domain-containing protein [Arenibacter sp. F20364]|uniref:DUF3052 domain-containing protein n=1 Tax=Arenibacter sp. F20364 TaxID=2926415 RepID=UPI001FF13E86|nr:DUF3052 domain-containing protein [Arenibacter sp. F20364]MCK0188911.1 DUF3052 domain-containing protein [Arenibacter sp. F20364]